MVSSQWKRIERFVAHLVGGKRTFDTEVDVMVVSDPGLFSWEEVDDMDGAEIGRHSRAGRLDAWAIEVKNWQKITVPQIEGILEHNQAKADGYRMKSALVVKRKAGAPTPYLVVIALDVPAGEHA